MRKPLWQAAGVGGALLLLAGMGGAAEGLAVGQRPPEFSARDLRGGEHSLAQYRGRVVVLHFWASWCPYCRQEIPKLLQLHHEASPAVAIVAVSVDQEPQRLDQFLARTPLPYPVIRDAALASSLADRYKIVGLPTTFLIDAGGRIAAKLEGVSDLLGAVHGVLGASPAP